MRLGFYESKYWLRKKIKGLLPIFSNVNPSWLTFCLIPIGLLTAFVYFMGAKYGRADWIFWGILLILLRMFFATMDGLVAEHFQKCTPKGELLNRLLPEICDVLLMIALAMACPSLFSFVALGVSWLVSYTGLLPLMHQKKVLQIGPLGQTDKLIALIVFSLAYPIFSSALTGFFIWCSLAGFLTFFIRLKKGIYGSKLF